MMMVVMKVYRQAGSLNLCPEKKHIGLGIDSST